jgi:hypothetical protein
MPPTAMSERLLNLSADSEVMHHFTSSILVVHINHAPQYPVLCHFFGRGAKLHHPPSAHTTRWWSVLRTSHWPPLHRGSLSHKSTAYSQCQSNPPSANTTLPTHRLTSPTNLDESHGKRRTMIACYVALGTDYATEDRLPSRLVSETTTTGRI